MSQFTGISSDRGIAQRMRRMSPEHSLLVVAALATAVPAIIDLFTFGVNVTILYVVPLLMVGQLRSRRWIWQWLAVLVALTYGLYAMDFRGVLSTHPSALISWRLMNRTLVVLTLCVVAVVLHGWASFRDKLALAGAVGADRSTFDDIADSLQHFAGALISVLLVACIALTDIALPGEFNLPILYGVPMTVGIWLESRRLVWVLLPFALVLSVAGFAYGKPMAVDPDWLTRILTNRALAMVALVLIAFTFHVLIRRKPLRFTAG